MKVLLDTHALLWSVTGDKRLGQKARQTFLDPDNRLFFSMAGVWELCIKMSLGKIFLEDGWFDILQRDMNTNAIAWLPIETRHCRKVAVLPFHHRDPFDRMLVAQAIVDDMCLLSRDNRLAEYAVRVIW